VAGRVRIDLIVADVGLLEGHDDLADRLRSIGDVLYVNGPTDSALADDAGRIVLASPFSLEDLRKAVATALRRPQ
jgi:hypothetical protein